MSEGVVTFVFRDEFRPLVANHVFHVQKVDVRHAGCSNKYVQAVTVLAFSLLETCNAKDILRYASLKFHSITRFCVPR